MSQLLGDHGEIVELRLVQGQTVELELTFEDSAGTPVDLTGATIAAQIRAVPLATGAALATFTSAITDAVNGIVTLTIPSADTAEWTWTRGHWDIQYTTAGGDTIPVCYGPVYVRTRVTS